MASGWRDSASGRDGMRARVVARSTMPSTVTTTRKTCTAPSGRRQRQVRVIMIPEMAEFTARSSLGSASATRDLASGRSTRLGRTAGRGNGNLKARVTGMSPPSDARRPGGPGEAATHDAAGAGAPATRDLGRACLGGPRDSDGPM